MKAFNYIFSQSIKILAAGLLTLLLANTATGQACKQVEILHNSPDCLNPRTQGTAGDRKDCPAVNVCVNTPYTYTASGSWSTYLWTVTGTSPVVISPNNTPAVNITWPAVGTYTLTLTVTDASGNVFTTCLTVDVRDKPAANFTFTPNNVCAGSIITFTNTTTGTGNMIFNWDFGDPLSAPNNTATTTSVGTTVNHQYNSPGTYTVTLIASSYSVVPVFGGPAGEIDSVIKTCCSDTIKKTVTILPGTFKIECVSTVCAGDTATYHAVGCANPTWLTPVGGTILATSGNSITIVWGNGAVQGQVQAVCPGSCTTSVVVPIIPQNPQPSGNLNPCFNSTTSYTLPLLPGTYYNWQLNNTTTGTNHNSALSTYPDNNTVIVNWTGLPAGTYELVVNLNNKHICCSKTGKITITPKPRFNINPTIVICEGSSFTFTTNLPGTFNWVTAAPATGVVPPSQTSSPTYGPTFGAAGEFYITATDVAGQFCNASSSIKIQVVATPAPGSISGPATICPGLTVYNYTISTPAPAGYYYSWSITGGTFQPGSLTTATGDNVSVQWSGPGTLNAILQRNSAPPCPKPVPAFSVTLATMGGVFGDSAVCVDESVTYNILGGTLPPGENIQWTISPSNLGTITAGQGTSSPTLLWHGQVTGAGPWTATLTATSGCGTASKIITINRPPIASITVGGAANVCLGTVTLTATAGYTYVWSPGGATTASINVTTPGTYSAAISSNGCTIIRTVTVPDPFAIIPGTCGVGFCNGTATNEQLSVQVIQPGSGTFTYQWYSGTYPGGSLLATTGPTTATSNNFTAPADGPYYVVVTYGTCQKVATFNVAKVCCPDVNNPQITSVVRNSCNQFTFTGTTPNPTGAAITWYFGDGSSAPGTSGTPISHTYANAGIYCVKFCVGPPSPNPTSCTGNCTSTTVVVPLQAAISYTLGCNGCINVSNGSTVLPVSANAPTVSYIWNFGDGTIITNTTGIPPAHCYTTAGSYTLSLTINYSDPSVPLTCTSTASLPVNYTPLSINIPTPVCTGQFTPMSSTPGGFAAYAWDFGDTYSSYTSTTTHAYNTPGPYTVTLSVTDLLGNTCTASQLVTVNPGIASCTIQPAFLCPGGTAVLSATAGLGTYLWQVETSPGVFAPAPGINTNNTYTATATGFYRVIITNGFNCQCISNKVEVKAAPRPKALIGASPSSLCGPGLVTLSTPVLPNHTYAWHAGTVTSPSVSASPNYFTFVSTTTTYFLVLTNEYGCKDTCQMTITVNPIPAPPNISANPTLCEGVPITLSVTNYTGNITWNTGAATTSITVSAAGAYTATYTHPVTGCTSSATRVINRRPSADLFPHFCDTMPCNCRKDSIFAPRPLIGLYAGPYNYQWFYNGNPVGGSTPYYTPAPGGTYQVIITDPMTGCKDTSNTYSIVVPPCDTCNCAGSHWGEIIMTQNNQPKVIQCNSSITVPCNTPVTINASFFCADTACPPKITYALKDPAGTITTGTGVPFTFTPNQNGSYTLKLYGWCGNKICDSCIIKFTTTCDTCNCANSKWGEIIMVTPAGEENVFCGKTYNWNCNTPFTLNATYLCAPPTVCPSSPVTYTLQPPSGGPVSGTLPLSYTPTQNGTYTITMYGWCNGVICDSCVIQLVVTDCPPCNCDGSGWKEIIVSTGTGNQEVIQCGSEVNALCNQPISINAIFSCPDPAVCAPMVTWSLQPPTGGPVTGTGIFNYTPAINGIYTLTFYGYCGTQLCDSCIIKFNVNCDPGCDCANSYWGDKYITMPGGGMQALNCGATQHLECNLAYTVNAFYQCGGTGCPSAVTYQLTGPAGSSSGAVPFNFTPTVSGTYTLTLYGYCNGILCDSCVVRFVVDCVPTTCCRDTIVVGNPLVQIQNLGTPPAAIANSTFPITGPATAKWISIRAEVVNYELTDNYNGECLKCKQLPYSWASVYRPSNIGTMTPQITFFNATAPLFNPAGTGQYQNPREVTWSSNTPFALPGSINMSFLLPPPPIISCCELRARICVKFTFRDKDCNECEVVVCFNVQVLPSPQRAGQLFTGILRGW